MKRNIRLLTGMAAFGVAACLAGSVQAQPPQNGIQQVNAVVPAQPPRTRIAFVNVARILQEYQKCANFKREMEESYKSFDKVFEGKRQLLIQYQNDAQKVAGDANAREQVERKVRDVQREMQDVQDEAKKVIGKKNGDQLVIIYKEIEEAATVYARAKDIELVMQYTDTIAAADMHNPNNIQRKLGLGTFPIYMAPGMDITGDVLMMLNTRYTQMMGAAAPAATAPVAGQPQR